MNKNMTALVSAFVRCYHMKNSNIKIYEDRFCEKIIAPKGVCYVLAVKK